jgi:hypothetical protein
MKKSIKLTIATATLLATIGMSGVGLSYAHAGRATRGGIPVLRRMAGNVTAVRGSMATIRENTAGT